MSNENIVQSVTNGEKILIMNDLINELEYELHQGMYEGDMATNVKAYVEHLKEQVNKLNK